MDVRILQKGTSTGQTGCWLEEIWLIEPAQSARRDVDPLMGWPAATDTLSTLQDRLRFETLDDAISFARQRGWTFEIEPPEERQIRPKSFLDRFRLVRPEDEERALAAKIEALPKGGRAKA